MEDVGGQHTVSNCCKDIQIASPLCHAVNAFHQALFTRSISMMPSPVLTQ